MRPRPTMRLDPTDDFQYRFDRLNHMLAGEGRVRPPTRNEILRMLSILHHEFVRRRPIRGGSRDRNGLHESFHMLQRRAERARGNEALREVVRDARQLLVALSSYHHTEAMEARLHELEGQIQGAVTPIEEDRAADDTDVITIESLQKKRVLFAIMPFADEFTDTWLGAVKRAASGTGLVPIRIDMITKTSEITDDIVKVIRMAEVVVVDVTGNNANVMFEFGFALALRKPHVVISQSTDYLTFDIKNLRTLIYRNTWQGLEALHKELQNYIRGASPTKKKDGVKKG